MLFLDGVYVECSEGSVRFRWVKAPTSAELTRLAQTLAQRIRRFLERQGATPEARIRHRHRDLSGLWRGGEDHRLHPTAGQGLFLQSYCIPAIHGGQMQEVE